MLKMGIVDLEFADPVIRFSIILTVSVDILSVLVYQLLLEEVRHYTAWPMGNRSGSSSSRGNHPEDGNASYLTGPVLLTGFRDP